MAASERWRRRRPRGRGCGGFCGFSTQHPLKMPKRLHFGGKNRYSGSRNLDAIVGAVTPKTSTRTEARRASSNKKCLCQIDRHGNEKSQAAAAPGAKFLRVVRALLLGLPPHHVTAAMATATTPSATQATVGEGPIKVEGGQTREREWAPRTALDFSGHSFAKSLQVHGLLYVPTGVVCALACHGFCPTANSCNFV